MVRVYLKTKSGFKLVERGLTVRKTVLAAFLLFIILLTSVYITGRKEMSQICSAVQSSKPQKIVSLSLASDEILLSLVDVKRIKALTYLSTDPAVSNVSKEAKEVNEHIAIDLEKIISLHPDLVVTSSFTPMEVVKLLRKAGLEVYTFQLSTNLKEIKANILHVAQVVGEFDKGKALIAQMDKQEKEITGKIITPGNYRVIYYSPFTGTQGKGTQFDELTKKLGLRNAAAEAGLVGPTSLNKEQLIKINPDFIFLAGYNEDDLRSFIKDPSLDSIKAIKEKKVYIVTDKHLSSYSHYILLGMKDLAKLAYPKAYR